MPSFPNCLPMTSYVTWLSRRISGLEIFPQLGQLWRVTGNMWFARDCRPMNASRNWVIHEYQLATCIWANQRLGNFAPKIKYSEINEEEGKVGNFREYSGGQKKCDITPVLWLNFLLNQCKMARNQRGITLLTRPGSLTWGSMGDKMLMEDNSCF